jgi:tripartite-type tricarboxylate transporter receptor subunit TctC
MRALSGPRQAVPGFVARRVCSVRALKKKQGDHVLNQTGDKTMKACDQSAAARLSSALGRGRQMRRTILHCMFAASMLGAPLPGLAQPAAPAYPTRPVTMVVPFAPGGSSDLVARVVAMKLAVALGQPVIVENRTGAGGEIGIGVVARAKADGYTLLASPSGSITAGPHFRKQAYDVLKDLTPVAPLAAIPTVFVVKASLPVSNLAEFISYAKQRPGQLSCGNPGLGSGNHLAAEMLQYMGHFSMVAVPYKGAAAMALAVASGELDAGSGDLTSFMPFVASGKVRILAAYGPTRMVTAPDIPTVAQAGVDNYRALSWAGLFAPAALPAPILARLNEEVARALQHPDVIDAFLKAGVETAAPMSAEKFSLMVREEFYKTGKLIKDAKIQAN